MLFITTLCKIVCMIEDFNPNDTMFTATVPSIAGLLMTWQIFIWAQLYKKIAMYWSVIVHSIMEARFFGGFVFILILSFTFAMMILDAQQSKVYEQKGLTYAAFTSTPLQNKFFDTLFEQYLLVLGEFTVLGWP